ncbi:MAG: TIGR00730 family Rossman fold protein [Candidatus Eremiobacteraeota bacterium]|nr:TIGR00730 family Rossman fold protein [Candidatus Eremiobacteraeota bacterium]
MPRLCIFCGAHAGRNGRFRDVAVESARAIVEAGYGIVYGGGRVGLMGAIADAALAAGGEVVGVIPEALSSEEVAHSGVTTLHVVQSMHERKALMADLSDGFIALPGGFGTMDEFHEILTWRQLGIHNKPVGLLNVDGYYDELLALYERMERDGFVRPETRALFTAAHSIDALLSAFRDTSGNGE